jgi:hypothetical protein
VADLPTWLTAGGTIATSIVAVGLALGSPYLAERYNRISSPRLKVTFEDADVDPRLYGSPNHIRYRLKIRVANTGPTSAQGVRAYVTDYVAKTYPQVGQRPYARFTIDPLPGRVPPVVDGDGVFDPVTADVLTPGLPRRDGISRSWPGHRPSPCRH